MYQNPQAHAGCNRRLKKCAEILSHSRNMHRNIDDIAYLCGFSSLPYFYRRFKQRYGCTPREYRLNAPGPGQDRPQQG